MRRYHFRLWLALLAAAVGLALLLDRTGGLRHQVSRRWLRTSHRRPRPELPAVVKVGWVADGDTFAAEDGTEVRLLSIDAPEYGEPFSRAATNRLRELIAGREVQLEYEMEPHDRYGRLLCHVRVGGVWVNELLVREGLAIVYLTKPNISRSSELIAAQKEARQRRLGMWSLPPPPPAEYYVYSSNSFRFHRPGCPFAKRIPVRNRLRLRTRTEAFDKGLSPCRRCKP